MNDLARAIQLTAIVIFLSLILVEIRSIHKTIRDKTYEQTIEKVRELANVRNQ